jgi:hypothetical protein
MTPVLILLAALSADPKPKQTDTTFAHLAPLAMAIAKADKVVLFEGLPHQSEEKDLLEQELKSKKTVTLHNFPFYAEPLSLKANDGTALIALAANRKSFQEWGGPKLCGGFHPDYLIEFTAGKDTYRMLVCFGCHEVKLFGPKSEVYVDMSDDGLHGLEKLLKPYRKNRP